MPLFLDPLLVLPCLPGERRRSTESTPQPAPMASTTGLLPEKSFLCSLCKDVFSGPVTTPCGHSFCLSCLSDFWTRHQSRYCPQCRRLFTYRPQLSINHILADISENYKKTRPEKPPEEETVKNVEQMIEERLQKVERLKSSLELQKSSYLREVRESEKVFSALVSAMEKNHKALVLAIEQCRREEEKKVHTLVTQLEQEIRELKKETADPISDPALSKEVTDEQEESNKDNIAPPGRSIQMKDWSMVTIETDPCVGFTRRALSELMAKMKAEVNRLSKSELKRIERYIVDINLSAKTAHPSLAVSEDRKQVRQTDKCHEVPQHPKRFDRVANVLAKESISRGRCYWEVEVGEKMEWSLGVVRQSINRKGRFTVCPANGFWTLSLKAGGQYVANSAPVTAVALEQKPRKVGVFVDYPAGRVAFYCADTGVHVHSFTDTFTDSLHPFFNPGRLHGGRNVDPLIITSSVCSI
ncbi:bloodthirsty-related gene family, member 2 [Nerophis ophidion]|uniref:bloodthirsty-related gene family, member 2 n=1 Tax=Nerophis ophidion TaxID=159077 RepID=UPI002AE066BD|nr:bloodthirsty-related gene family, member 2 [Nerophis ophidion]